MKACLILTLALLLAVPASSSCETNPAAQDYPEELTVFVDLDGDGINDSARDRDNDGIPDVFGAEDSDDADDAEVADVELLVTETSEGFGMEGVFDTPVNVSSSESNFAKYAEYEFAARDLTKDRGGFDSERDPESGSASRGKICIGGVCF